MSNPQIEKHAFEAEVDQVLSIVVNSLYSHREVFLRELISNASDALDKLSFQALTDKDLLADDGDMHIRIRADKEARTLTIDDSGIGMSHDDLIENLGTIARSGTRQLAETLAAQGGDAERPSLIGQFGVGFYSSFLVADNVVVTSRVAGSSETWRWESDAKHGFTIETADRPTRGTEVVLHLKEDCGEFLEEWTLKSLVRKYSDYVRHKIELLVTKTTTLEEKDDEGNPKTETTTEWETVNQASALWTRPKSEVSDEQYNEFYKHLSHDWSDPLAWTHFKVEGTQEMTGLLFVPSTAPLDLFERRQRGIRLFVKRVFIMEDCEEILPEWLRFMRGVVDSEDLPLNVSREILQQERTTRAIKKQVIKKTLALLGELADEGEKKSTTTDDEGNETESTQNRYATFWEHFGRVLKEGVHYDPEHKDEIARLLRFESTREEGPVSLFDYLGRMEPDQPGIYYITGDSVASCRNSPHLEALRKKGYEVLYMADPVDEWVVQALTEFEEKKLISAAKGALELPESEDEKKEKEEKSSEMSGLVDAMKSNLESRVKEVRITSRLTDSPACLVTEENELSPHLERILRASGQDVPEMKRILELNPDHPVVDALQKMAGDDARKGDLTRWSSVLFDQALLAEGTMPEDPGQFAKEIAAMMAEVVGR